MVEPKVISAESNTDLYRDLEAQLRALLADERDLIANAANTASLIFHSLPDVNWAGFYILMGGQLVLGPFHGKPACTRIELGKGVCGTAPLGRETVVVPDLNAFEGHVACDHASQSEIVVPLLSDGRLMGLSTSTARRRAGSAKETAPASSALLPPFSMRRMRSLGTREPWRPEYRERPVDSSVCDRSTRCGAWSVIDRRPAIWFCPTARRHRFYPDQGMRVVGAMTTAQSFALSAGDAVVGIRFKPGAAARVIGASASEFTDCSIPLSDVWGRRGRGLDHQLANAASTAEQIALLRRIAGEADSSRGSVPAPSKLSCAAGATQTWSALPASPIFARGSSGGAAWKRRASRPRCSVECSVFSGR